MTQQFFVPVQLPGANDCLWKHWKTFRRLKQEAQQVIGVSIRKARLSPMRSAEVVFEWCEPDMRRDPDNVTFAQKFVLDSLVDIGILTDDGWAYIIGISHRVVLDPEHPGVRVTLHAGKEGIMATTKKKKAVKPKEKKAVVRRAPPTVGTAEPMSS